MLENLDFVEDHEISIRLKKYQNISGQSQIKIGPLRISINSPMAVLKKSGVIDHRDQGFNVGRRYQVMEVFNRCEKLSQLSSSNWDDYPKQNEIIQSLSKIKEHWFLEDLLGQKKTISLTLPILAQIYFETQKIVQSRLVQVLVKKTNRYHLAVAANMPYERDVTYFVFIEGHFDRMAYQDIEVDLSEFSLESNSSKDQKLKSGDLFEIINFKGQSDIYTIAGRSELDRRMKKEEKLIQEAGDSEVVPFEIYFHPYYRAFGHTTLRIGSVMYELGTKGWRAHRPPEASARTFLFNNPFFKSQFEKYGWDWITPISLGTTVFTQKKRLLKIQSLLDKSCDKSSRLQFNILFNNCNQGVVTTLGKSGYNNVKTNGYKAFSSVLSFRSFLYSDNFSDGKKYIYSLPGHSFTDSELRSVFPEILYKENSSFKEFKRGWPIYITDLAQGPYSFVRKKILRFQS